MLPAGQHPACFHHPHFHSPLPSIAPFSYSSLSPSVSHEASPRDAPTAIHLLHSPPHITCSIRPQERLYRSGFKHSTFGDGIPSPPSGSTTTTPHRLPCPAFAASSPTSSFTTSPHRSCNRQRSHPPARGGVTIPSLPGRLLLSLLGLGGVSRRSVFSWPFLASVSNLSFLCLDSGAALHQHVCRSGKPVGG